MGPIRIGLWDSFHGLYRGHPITTEASTSQEPILQVPSLKLTANANTTIFNGPRWVSGRSFFRKRRDQACFRSPKLLMRLQVKCLWSDKFKIPEVNLSSSPHNHSTSKIKSVGITAYPPKMKFTTNTISCQTLIAPHFSCESLWKTTAWVQL